MEIRGARPTVVPAWIRASALGATLGAIASPASAGGPATIRFEQQSSQVVEGARSVSTSLVLHTPDAQPLPATAWVEYGTRDTTARHGYDYTGIVRTVELPAGTPPGTVVTVTIELHDDDVDENDEVFEIRLLQVWGAAVPGLWDTHFVTIVDEDPPPAVIVEDAITGEAECGWTYLYFRLELSSPSERWPTVSYATADGTATAPADYLPRSGTLTFYPGQPFLTVEVPLRDDLEMEPDEVVRLLLGNASFVTLPDPEGTGTIPANDLVPLPPVNGQLTHGSTFTGNLGPDDGTPNEDFYALVPEPGTSLEVLVEGTGRVAPALVDVNCGGLGPIGPTVAGVGSVIAVRSEGSSPAPFGIETARLRIRASDCIFDCNAADAYRVTMRDTTYTVERVVQSATQSSVLIVQNLTNQDIWGTFRLWKPDGSLVNALFGLDVRARGIEVINLSWFLSNGSGSLTLTHNGPYGSLAGKIVVIEPSTGSVSESPLLPRRN